MIETENFTVPLLIPRSSRLLEFSELETLRAERGSMERPKRISKKGKSKSKSKSKKASKKPKFGLSKSALLDPEVMKKLELLSPEVRKQMFGI